MAISNTTTPSIPNPQSVPISSSEVHQTRNVVTAQPEQPASEEALRKKYDDLALQVSKASKEGKADEVARLKPLKLDAFNAWRRAYNERRHAQLTRLRTRPV